MLTRFFSAADLQALWKRLAVARGRHSLTVKSAWDALRSMEAEKWSALVKYIQNPNGSELMNYLIEMKETIEKSEEAKRTSKPLYR